VEVRVARSGDEWSDAAGLLLAYQQETAIELGMDVPTSPGEVWEPVRHEVAEPAAAFPTYVVAYEGPEPLGGVALVAHDASSLMLKRGYVRPDRRRRGVARAMTAAAMDEAEGRGLRRLVVDILPSREEAITAWQRLGFAECRPWGEPTMRYFERTLADVEARPWLGLQRGVVTLHDHDERWAKAFQHHAEVLRRALANQVTAIEHVGSTAVVDLVAKPIVDVAARLAPDADERSLVTALDHRGYEFRGDQGAEGGLLFVASDAPCRRTVHVHVVRHDDPEWERYLLFRGRLRRDREVRAAYAALKDELAQRFPDDRVAYTAAKEAFIEAVLRPR
jgi:GrpB-like predicted nucleotidyltransferase (UPF0157 family)/GNAT superfamily N-acetyltransferase